MKRIVATFVLVGVSSAVWAGWRRHSAAFCAPQYETDWYEMTTNRGLIAKGLGDGHFFCPVLDDSKFARTSLAYVNVHVNDTNTAAGRNVSVVACVTYYGSLGSACGNAASTTSVGPATLNPDISKWIAFPADFAFLHVTVCPNCQLYGYFPGT